MIKRTVLLFAFVFLISESLFSWDKCIVVTTIQYPTPQLRKLSQIPGWHLIVVGDKKTPKDWYLENCDYLSPERQLKLGYQLADLLPWNHYSRKNLGYLFAIENGAKVIYETDDDNEWMFEEIIPTNGENQLTALTCSNTCLNIYAYFGLPSLWPRGYPLEKIKNTNDFQETSFSPCKIGVEQGIVNESPDVDAIFRLTQDRVVNFEQKPACFLPEGIFCPFNSQNTFFHPIAFFTLYLPSTVSMRVSDIWRGYISQKLMWKQGANLVFSGPNAIQKRNEHSLIHDFLLEQALYLQSNTLVGFLGTWQIAPSETAGQMTQTLYKALVQKEFFKKEELPLLKAWFADLKKVGYK